MAAEGLSALYNAVMAGVEHPVLYTDLRLGGTGVQRLPDNLHVKGDADLRVTSITELPKGLVVGGKLNITGLGIQALPADAKVGEVIGLFVPEKPAAAAPAVDVPATPEA